MPEIDREIAHVDVENDEAHWLEAFQDEKHMTFHALGMNAQDIAGHKCRVRVLIAVVSHLVALKNNL